MWSGLLKAKRLERHYQLHNPARPGISSGRADFFGIVGLPLRKRALRFKPTPPTITAAFIVSPFSLCLMLPESTISTVWPTIGAVGAGRWVGRLAGLAPSWDSLRLFGKLMAAATIPVSLVVFFGQLMPYLARRYRLTNYRIAIDKGLKPSQEKAVALSDFDAIDVEVLPGQDWLHSGDLVFRRAGQEVFRLSGVGRPGIFREACLKARTALVATQQVLAAQAAPQQGA